MNTKYIHPITKEPLRESLPGLLVSTRDSFIQQQGCYDFVRDPESAHERDYHDKEYTKGAWVEGALDSFDFPKLWKEGLDGPDLRVLNSMGPLQGKRVLLLGNGTSVSEFYFAHLGALVTYTDLSIVAVQYQRKRWLESTLGKQHPERMEFHAVNAYHLPFADGSFDVVYGCAFIHHMLDITAAFTEIKRVLAPAGIVRFADTAYSPIWQGSKQTILRPLQAISHRWHGISPEDRKATAKGGYKLADCEQIRREVGFMSIYYERTAFFDYLVWRAKVKLRLPVLLRLRPMLRRLDAWLEAHTSFMERNGITLVFGFAKDWREGV